MYRRLWKSRNDVPSGPSTAYAIPADSWSRRIISAGFGTDMAQWSGPAIELAVAETKAFKARLAASVGRG